MLDPRTQALSVDLSLGFSALAFGIITGGSPRTLDGVAAVTFGVVVLVVLVFVSEHSDLLEIFTRTRPMSLIFVALAFTGVGVSLIIDEGATATPAIMWGIGAGLVAYRLTLGVLLPLPSKRQHQADLWGKPPEPQERESSGWFR